MPSRDGKKKKVGLADATVVEVNRARLDLLRGKKPHAAAPEEAALRAKLAKHPGLAKIDLRVVADSVRIGPVPLGLVAALAAALGRARVG